MRWRTGRRSRNIEVRRSVRIPKKAAGGGIGIIVIALIAMYFGVVPTVFLSQQGPPSSSVSTYTTSKPILLPTAVRGSVCAGSGLPQIAGFHIWI